VIVIFSNLLAGESELGLITLQELKTTNPKIKKEAQNVLAELVSQLGPRIKVLVMSLIKSPEIKSDLELCFAKVSYDPSSLPTSWPKQSLADRSSSTNGPESKGTSTFDLPKTDLFSLLPPDTVSKLVRIKSCYQQRFPCMNLNLWRYRGH
jgi:hypothetical protein